MSNNTKKGKPAKKQTILVAFLMQNNASNLENDIQSNLHEDMDADRLIFV